MKIVSGGQTGVDRAALDVAIELGIGHGGWCPRGRLAEDGPIAARYLLCETEAADYAVRTERNVLDSDATIVLCQGTPDGGTELTVRLALRHAKPCLSIDLDQPRPLAEIGQWLTDNRVTVLNVAGPRESRQPGIGKKAGQLLRALLAP